MRRLAYRTVKWKISLPATLAGRVELRLSNSAQTGPAYASRSKLIEDLLSDWLREQEKDDHFAYRTTLTAEDEAVIAKMDAAEAAAVER